MIDKKIALIITFVIFIFSAYTSYSYFSGNNGVLNLPNTKYTPPNGNGSSETVDSNEPKTEECPLNGQMMTTAQKAKWVTRRPLGIMVENHKDARPQSGLTSADVIYEAVAEGGITRFLAVFYCQDAKYIGPVRSARIYFLKLLQGYGNYPLYAHVGGANTEGPADALGEINDLDWAGYNDLNQFSVPFPNFWRDYDRLPGVATEHTVYTNSTKLWDFAKTKRELTNVDKEGVAWDENFKKWSFKDDAKTADRGDVAKISFGFWDFFASDFAVTWNYNSTNNSYSRVNGGAPHIDKNTGKPLMAKDVIIVFAKESPANDGYPGGHILYKVVGSGDALIFQDGKAIKGSWTKEDEESMMSFEDNDGKVVSLVRGPIFVEVLPVGNKVTY